MFTKPRYEFKYIISLDEMRAFQNRLDGVMELDPNAIDGGYHVNSIYYDTQDLSCYYEKIDGEKRRFKVRVRWYGELEKESDLSSLSLFAEIKHRNNDTNFKNRLKLPGKYLPGFSENQQQLLRLSQYAEKKDLLEATTIEHIVSQRLFMPLNIVSYHRKAYLCRINPQLRITFDTSLRAFGTKNILNVSSSNGITVLPKDICVLELKFNWAIPLWLLEITREVGLNLRRFSKYAAGLEKLYPEFTMRSIRYQEFL
jgi:SPX domain protein involved in polyphosphate accumulation